MDVQAKDVVPSNVKCYDHMQSRQIVRISDPIQNRNHFMTGPVFESQLFCLTVGLVFESHQFMFSLQCYLQIKIVNPQQRCKCRRPHNMAVFTTMKKLKYFPVTSFVYLFFLLHSWLKFLLLLDLH